MAVAKQHQYFTYNDLLEEVGQPEVNEDTVRDYYQFDTSDIVLDELLPDFNN